MNKLKNYLLIVFVACILKACNNKESSLEMDKKIDAGIADILSRIKEPVIPNDTIILYKFAGVKPDPYGTHDFYLDIKNAIEELSKRGGGKLYFAHTMGKDEWVKTTEVYRVKGPIQLKSNIELCFDPNIKLQFEFDPASYLPDGPEGTLRRYEGTMLYSFCPLIYAFNCENIALTSTGKNGAIPIIHGDGERWVQWHSPGEKKRMAEGRTMAYKYLRKVNESGSPIKDRVFTNVNDDFFRPELFLPLMSKNILVEGIKFEESPFWMLHPVFCENVIFRDVWLDGQMVNNDGIDPEGCIDVLIENVVFNTHDDNIALKSGRDREAREGAPIEGTELEKLDSKFIKNGRIGTAKTENVVVRNCMFKNHYAFCIGSEIAAGAKNVYVVDNHAIQDVKMGIFLKSNRTRGGIIEDIYVRNFQINKVSSHDAICIISNYDGDSISPYPPKFKNIYIEGVRVKSAKRGIRIYGWHDALVENVTIKNVTIDEVEAEQSFVHNYVENLVLDQVIIEGKTLDGVYNKEDRSMPVPRQE